MQRQYYDESYLLSLAKNYVSTPDDGKNKLPLREDIYGQQYLFQYQGCTMLIDTL